MVKKVQRKNNKSVRHPFVCEQCGNPIRPKTKVCPFCGLKRVERK